MPRSPTLSELEREDEEFLEAIFNPKNEEEYWENFMYYDKDERYEIG